MKWIKNLDGFLVTERLNVSRDISQIIYELAQENDRVANFLSIIISSDIYDDDDDLNNIDISKELNKFSFVPKKMRGETRFNHESMPTRIGKIVNKILSKCKKYLKTKIQSELRITLSRGEEDTYFIHVPNEQKIIIPTGDNLEHFEKSKLTLKILGLYDEQGNYTKLKKADKIDLEIENSRYTWSNYIWFSVPDNVETNHKFTVSDNPKLSTYKDKNILGILEFESKIELTDSEIENFVNKVVAYQKINRADESATIEEVKGEDIRFWYNRKNYLSEKGELGSSCMSYERCQPYLDMYCVNVNQVSLLILKNKEDKLVGRAIKWKLDDGKSLVDRIYTILNSDTNIFIAHAKKMGYHYTLDHRFYFDNKIVNIEPEVSLDNWDFNKYPYLDNLQNLNMGNGVLSSEETDRFNSRVLTSTSGGWENTYDDEDYDEDYDDD